MNNSFIKKAAAGLLSLALVFGTFAYAPQGTFADDTAITASAEGEQSEIEVADETELAAALGTQGVKTVRLTADIELTKGIVIEQKEVMLDMNGHSISTNSDAITMFTVTGSSTVTVGNSAGGAYSVSGGSIIFQLINGSYIAVAGISEEAPVTLSGASNAAVMVTPGCNMNLTNAVVENNTSGILNLGTITVTDCKIRNNTSQGSGAGILNNAVLHLNGVEITGNKAAGSVGGGVYVSPGATTELSGRIVIKDNISTLGEKETADDIYFLSGGSNQLTFGSRLADDSEIYVNVPAKEGEPFTLTDYFAIYNDPEAIEEIFHVGSDYGIMHDENDEVVIYKKSNYMALNASISLTDSLDLNFDFRVPDSEREGGKIVLDGPNGKVEKSASEIVESELGIGVSYPIYANQMYLPVTAAFVDKEGVEHSFVNTTDKKTFSGYCVNDYLNNFYKNYNVEGNENYVNMVKAVYTYGAYSANKFSEQALPATGGIMLDVSDVTSSKVNAEISEPGLWDRNEVEGFQYRGISLVLDSKTSMKIYFFSANEHEYTYTDGNNEYPLNAKLVSTSSSGDKLYYVEVPGISLSELGKQYTIKAGGKLIYKGSAMNFVRAAVAPTTQVPGNTQNIAKALYKCYEYAKAM